MTDRQTLLERLRAAGGNAAIDLAETALVLAALDRPGTPIEPYRQHLATLAADVAAAAHGAAEPIDKVGAIRDVVFQTHGYAGDRDTYDDMQNANLISVIDRRKGLPVALGILCIHVARRQGWDMVGINFPSHFLIGLRAPGGHVMIDPFDDAQIVDDVELQRRLTALHGSPVALEGSHCRPVGDRDILLRLQNNIRLRAQRDGNVERALDVLDGMVLLAPGEAGLRLEMAALQAGNGRLKAAIGGLKAFLALAGESEGRGDIARLLQKLKGRLN